MNFPVILNSLTTVLDIRYYINNPYNSVLREKAMNSFMQTIRKVFYQYSLHGDVSRLSVLKNLTVEKSRVTVLSEATDTSTKFIMRRHSEGKNIQSQSQC